jgi:hypothetical protein
MRGDGSDALVSRKGVKGHLRNEVSETTKLGTDPTATLKTGQVEIVYRGIFTWVSNHIIVTPKALKSIYADSASLDLRVFILPREVSTMTSWYSGEVSPEASG